MHFGIAYIIMTMYKFKERMSVRASYEYHICLVLLCYSFTLYQNLFTPSLLKPWQL